MEKLYIPAWMVMILYLEDDNSNKVSRKIGITYSHYVRMLKIFRNKGLVKRRNVNKREYRYELTPKGKEIKKHCENIVGMVGGIKF